MKLETNTAEDKSIKTLRRGDLREGTGTAMCAFSRDDAATVSANAGQIALVADDGHVSLIPEDVHDLEALAQVIAMDDLLTTLVNQNIIKQRGACNAKSQGRRSSDLTIKVEQVRFNKRKGFLDVSGRVVEDTRIVKIDRLKRAKKKPGKPKIKEVVKSESTYEDNLRVIKIELGKQVVIEKEEWSPEAIAVLRQAINNDMKPVCEANEAAKQALDEFLGLVNGDDSNITKYGYRQVKYASEAHAIKTLLICDKLVQFCDSDRPALKKHVQKKIEIVNTVRENGGTVHIIKTDSEMGAKVKSYTGYVAILYFPLEDEDEMPLAIENLKL